MGVWRKEGGILEKVGRGVEKGGEIGEISAALCVGTGAEERLAAGNLGWARWEGGAAGRVEEWRAGWGCWAGLSRPGGVLAGSVGRVVVRTFMQPESVFVLWSKERAQKPGRIGNLEKCCGGLEEKLSLHGEK